MKLDYINRRSELDKTDECFLQNTQKHLCSSQSTFGLF